MLKFPIEFFDDEVRDGFYVPSIMKHNWAAQMEIVNTVDEICRRNNIKYFLFAGTLLGAVRHGGFIPWDDDMDICMLRKDYKRFLKALDREKPDHYWVRNHYHEKEYREVFTRLLDDDGVMMNPEFWEKRHGFVCNAGIDIFPLDYIPKDKEEKDRISHIIMHLHYIIKKYDDEGLTSELEGKLLAIEKEFKVKIKRDDTIPQQMYFLMDDILDSIKRSDSNSVHIFLRWAQDQCGDGIPIETLNETVDIGFETAKFMAPYYYDKLLESSFGTYMKCVRVCEIHNYPWYQGILTNLRKELALSDYPFIESVLPKKDRRKEWEQKCIGELNEIMELFGKASSLAEEAFSKGDNKNGNVLLEKCNELAVNAELIEKKIKGNEKERVVFLTWKPEYWDYYEPYYQMEIEGGNDVVVIPVPYSRLTETRGKTKEVVEMEGFPEYVTLTDFSTFNYEDVRISRIYTQNIYDDQNGATLLNPFFYTTNIREYTDELIYIPWFRLDKYGSDDIRAKFVSQYFMRMPGIVAVDRIILEKDQTWLRDYYVNELTEWAGDTTKSIWEEKIQISELETQNKDREKKDKKKIMYYIGTGQILAEPEKMIDKMRRNIEIFDSSSEKLKVKLFVEQGLIDKLEQFKPKFVDELKSVLNEYKDNCWCEYIEADSPVDVNNKEMIKELTDDIDAFYGDAGVLMHLVSEAKKPVMQQSLDC